MWVPERERLRWKPQLCRCQGGHSVPGEQHTNLRGTGARGRGVPGCACSLPSTRSLSPRASPLLLRDPHLSALWVQRLPQQTLDPHTASHTLQALSPPFNPSPPLQDGGQHPPLSEGTEDHEADV